MAAPLPPNEIDHTASREASSIDIVESAPEELPTASHALASESLVSPGGVDGDVDHGASQIEHGDVEVKNLGWNEDPANIPAPVVGGLQNEELWTLMRRFDKQVFHVKKIHVPPLANLDMNIADEEEFSPEKLRAQLERLYMVIAVGLVSLWNHVVRLRSWKETRRTAAFMAVYLVAWFLDILIPVFSAFLMTLIIMPKARTYCFPPAPLSLINSKTGGVQKPPAGVLASDDSITGAPEKHKGEAVEQEAHSFVNSISTLVVSTAAGKHPQADPHEDNSVPDPTQLTEDVSNAKEATKGKEPTAEHDRTRVPVSNAVWDKARPVMHLIADLVDTWERFGNMLSPTAPFPRRRPRLLLASCLVPVLIGSYFTTSYMAMKGAGFGMGFGFFGDPLITPGIEFINRTYPKWQKYVELRHTLLRGIPTNAQLAVTLLRIGEKNKAPIPPPPSSSAPPPVEPHATAGEGLEHLEGATSEEINDAVQVGPPPEAENPDDTEPTKHKKSHRIMNIIRGTAKGGIRTALAADKAKAKVGAQNAKDRLGVVKPGSEEPPATGPIRFPARYKGKRGHVYITATATTPAISWTSSSEDKDASWTTLVENIEEVRKVGGLGWKSKLLVGWAMGREVVDGMVVTTGHGEEWHVTAVEMRDDLFNRLIAIGSQMWELW